MNLKKRGLNRGLDLLLAGTGLLPPSQDNVNIDPNIDQGSVLSPSSVISSSTRDLNKHDKHGINIIQELPIATLIPGKFQPRQNIQPEELTELVASIQQQGILQPLIVRSVNNGKYEIIAGERRWRAATLAGLTVIPTIVKQVNDQDALSIALIENIQRDNLNPLDEALGLARLIEEFNLTHQEVALAVGKPRTSVTNLLRILQLPLSIQKMIADQQLDLGHAKVLLGAKDELRLILANKIIELQLSVRATEQLLKKYQEQTRSDLLSEQAAAVRDLNNLPVDPDLARLQQRLSDFFGAKVTILTKTKHTDPKRGNYAGQGKLIINYNSLEEFEGILEHFGFAVAVE